MFSASFEWLRHLLKGQFESIVIGHRIDDIDNIFTRAENQSFVLSAVTCQTSHFNITFPHTVAAQS